MKRKQINAEVYAILEPIAEEAGVVLLDVDFVREAGAEYLRVCIDREGGVRMEDCERISRKLSPLLDDLDLIPGGFNLEVSSPGLERVLKKDREFCHFQGRTVEISSFEPLEDLGRKFQGILRGLRDGVVLVETVGGRVVAIPREKIARAKLVLVPKRG